MIIGELIVILVVGWISFVDGSHFRGGTITWRPNNATPSGASTPTVVRERFSWRRSAFTCTTATIAAQSPMIGDWNNLGCVSGNCASWTGMNTQTYCTDFSPPLDVASGEYYQLYTFPFNIAFSISFSSCCWFNTLVTGSSGSWAIVSYINTAIRPDGYLNTSPVAVSLPIIYKEVNVQQVHIVQMSDFDGTDILQCRWSVGATTTINGFDECSALCNGVPGANLIQANCTIVFTLTMVNMYAGVALQIEDFFNGAATVPMSSVPLQFLFYGYAAPACPTPPAIIGQRPNRACIGVMPGDNVTEIVIVQTTCPSTSIVDFVSSVPVGMTKSAILNPSANVYTIVLSWTPVAGQYGPQAVCMGAIDSANLQSNQWCITFLVGFKSPDVIRPSLVQGSASPIGTVFQNQTTFSIQTSISVNRPTRNGTYIYFWEAGTDALIQKYDCGWEPEVTYTGFTVVIRFPVAPWVPGKFYYVTFDSGVASGTQLCGPESAPTTDKTFWVFNIWNPAVSSTTTTTTTPPTTITVTTRPTSTTSINTLLTTTGIVVTTTTPATTTATTTTTAPPTTAPPTTAGPTTTGATTPSTVGVMYPKDLEEACKQPVAMMTAVSMVAMMPLHALAMYAAFTKFSNIFNPSKINARNRHKQRMRRVLH